MSLPIKKLELSQDGCSGNDTVTPNSEATKTPSASFSLHGDAPNDALTPDLESVAILPNQPFQGYYDIEKKEYLIQNESGRWIPQSTGQLQRRLRNLGIGDPSCRDRILQRIEDRFDVRYAAPLAGRQAGFYDENGIRFLVTESPTFLVPCPGRWGTLRAVIEGLLVKGEPEHGSCQWDTFMGWIKTSVCALRENRHQHAQALAIAGPKDCGKSLVQHLITKMLGGRSAKGARYLMGNTEFNAELFEAEHIILEDEFMSHSIQDRLRLGTGIKNFTVSTQVQNCHRKNRTAINLKPWWRLTITLNDDPEALQVLPPLDDHIEDKVILLRASRFEMPMPTDTTVSRERFWNQLMSELPAFLYWLINDYQIPENSRDRRFIIKTWHHPEIKLELAQLAPETQLLLLIDELFVSLDRPPVWTGTAEDLRRALLNFDAHREAEKLLNWPNATGTYLGRLAKSHAHRIKKDRKSNKRLWVIAAPEKPDSFTTSVMASLPLRPSQN